MKVGITIRFQNSYFSGSLPQVACALARSLAASGTDVTLLYPAGESDWFIDLKNHAAKCPRRVAWDPQNPGAPYDVIIEVVWPFQPADRKIMGKRIINLCHYPPIFHDMESSVYNWNPLARRFEGLSEIWTYDLYSKQDVNYLQYLSGVAVQQIPYVWDPDPLDMFCAEESVPEWADGARRIESMLAAEVPPSMSWCARIVESNFSNSSHCIIPLNIVSEVRRRGTPIRFAVHNADHISKHDFFKQNIVRNLLLPDISGSIIARVRLPDFRREKVAFIAHQRWRPMKSFLLDAAYMGFPMIHNNEILKKLGAPYYYELNQIQDAVVAWNQMDADYKAARGFFAPSAAAVRREALRARFSPAGTSAAFKKLLEAQVVPPSPIIRIDTKKARSLRVAFANMWDDFQPRYNFFMYLLSWVGSLNGVSVTLDENDPNVVFFGPFSNGGEKRWPSAAKVFFTGENAPPNADPTTFLNLGFMYMVNNSYIRLPLWMLEVNWWGANVDKIVNPRPVSVAAATTVDTATLNSKQKFCAFVASNPSCQNRNAAFHILNQWRSVDAGGRLFCNMSGGPIPAGRGGGGGELAKVDFYKNYKFVLTYENSSAPGYTTEKLFHAKVGGAVPIYWGDPFVERDFDPKGFINANQVGSPDDLIKLVKKVADDSDAWKAMASVPAISPEKRRICERTMENVARAIFQHVLKVTVNVPNGAWNDAEKWGAVYESGRAVASVPTQPSVVKVPKEQLSEPLPPNRLFVTATNTKFAESAANVVASMRKYDTDCKIIVYVWPEVPEKVRAVFKMQGAAEVRELPVGDTSQTPWEGFWEPQHYAWKIWVQRHALSSAPADTCVLYLDAGVVIATSPAEIWHIIKKEGVFLLDDDTQQNERWCHPTFCKGLNVTVEELKGNQITAGLVGALTGSPYTKVLDAAYAAASRKEIIVGEKWQSYSQVCMGHRHDQSILSVLTQRVGLPRQPLNKFYCDKSLRAAQQFGTPLYVHRGSFKAFESFTKGIDEMYLINLERRADRLQKFKDAHKNIKDYVYINPAVDGKTLTLTPEIAACFRDNDFNWKKAIMGCALSHLRLWEKLANDSQATSYLIMEDDVKLQPDWLEKWKSFAGDVPADADVIYLGGVLPPNKPAFPLIVEPVNSHFGRVAKNNVFGGIPRRYFHFCNYAYILTRTGAQKLVSLIKQRGIFTSGDHMIVNHGDELFKIYFTTPLLAGCFQDDDPSYVNSQFNNFNRIDTFDSDLWNNDERFSNAEVVGALGTYMKDRMTAPATGAAAAAEHQAKAAPTEISKMTSNPEHIQTWNTFLRNIALKDEAAIRTSINAIFAIWETMSIDDFIKNISWYRIFEQLILNKNSLLIAEKELILNKIRDTFKSGTMPNMFVKVIEALSDKIVARQPSVETINNLPSNTINAYHFPEVNPAGFLECEWLDNIFPQKLHYTPLATPAQLFESQSIFVFQKLHGKDAAAAFGDVLHALEANGKQTVVLHLSDEFGSDKIDFYGSSAVKAVIRNYWRPDLVKYAGKVTVIPLGYSNGHSANYLPASAGFIDRKNMWSFAGSADRPGRTEGLAALASAGPADCHVKASWDDKNKVEGAAYNETLRLAKFIPCFRGFKALESFRIYEALEHGAIPIYVPSESAHGAADEYKEIYGTHPFLGFPSWEKAAAILPTLASKPEYMEKHRAQLSAWWSDKKAEVRAKIKSVLMA